MEPDFTLDPDNLHFIPLGGSEQFGVNFNLYAYKNSFLAVDLGIGFADQRFPGIDILLPDPAFAAAHRREIEALIITHAHEDHIGAVPHLWPRLRCPVYCTRFTALILKRKIGEFPESADMDIRIVSPGDTVNIGPFHVQFVAVAHSVPETCALIVETKAGRVVHSGDWNLDPDPVAGGATDEAAFQKAGKKGVLAYIGDSTNAGTPGRAGTESSLAKGLEDLFAQCRGRIAVTTFSSHIGRIRNICLAARATGRSICVVGRSLRTMTAVAHECGYLHGLPEFISEKDLASLPAERQLMIVTGSQGEPRAALAKIARGDMRDLFLTRGDMAVFSARRIPGNEKRIDEIRNALLAAGVRVVCPGDTAEPIHISGHAHRDEIADMLRWVKPETVIPVHGERVQLEAHADLARECQVPQVIVPANGMVIRLKKGDSAEAGRIDTGLLAVETGRLVPSSHPAISERRKLQAAGAAHVSVVLGPRGDLLADPQVATMGLIDPQSEKERRLEEDLCDEIADIIADMEGPDRQDDHAVHEELRIGVRRFVNLVLGVKPRTTVHVFRVRP